MMVMSTATLPTFAENITEQQALEVARHFIHTNHFSRSHVKYASAAPILHLAHKHAISDYAVDLYVYNIDKNGGFVIISGNDKSATSVLGYADEGSFDAENIPENLQYLLDEYSRQIEFINEQGIDCRKGTKADSNDDANDVSRQLLTTSWFQTDVYASACPGDYTGCVATAMAQVMNYWEWPVQGHGSHVNGNCLNQAIDFSASHYNWSNMLDDYAGNYSDTEGDAVAKLMADCGAAVNMRYIQGGSSAYSAEIPHALVSYFKYATTARYIERNDYKGNWNQMLIDELKAGRPVCYGGLSIFSGAHEFVCDGYRGDGYFHFNLALDGLGAGYYQTSAIGHQDFGYNYEQNVVIGICPDYEGECTNEKFCFTASTDGNACVDYAIDNGEMANIAIPSTTTIDGKECVVTKIGHHAFMECWDMQTVKIPETITAIDKFAFFGCRSLTSIIIPANISEIGMKSFYDCTSLTDVYCFAIVPPTVKSDSFDTFGTLHVLSGCEDVYAQSEVWNNFTIVPDLTNGIEHVSINRQGSAVYDLQGRAANQSAKGILIKEGKKYLK